MLHRHQVVWMGLQTILLYDVMIYFILHVSRLVGKWEGSSCDLKR